MVKKVAVLFLLLSPMIVSAALFTRDLKLGDSGADVKKLQEILNTDAMTRVAELGLGSPGKETEYFGQLTKSAVIKFQEKNRLEVLTPFSLFSGTGYIGAKTRQKLETIVAEKGKNIPLPPSSTPSNDNSQQASGFPSNYENLEKYIGDVRQAGKIKGYSDEQLATVEGQIRATVAVTTTNFRQQFISETKAAEVKHKRELAEAKKSEIWLTKLRAGWTEILETLIPSANAQFGSPFGGYMYYTFPCTCSAAWSVGISPLPPSYVPILDCYPGMQRFKYFSAPFATSFVGTYFPGVPSCWEYAGLTCIVIPSYGLMSPMVGSSI